MKSRTNVVTRSAGAVSSANQQGNNAKSDCSIDAKRRKSKGAQEKARDSKGRQGKARESKGKQGKAKESKGKQGKTRRSKGKQVIVKASKCIHFCICLHKNARQVRGLCIMCICLCSCMHL